MIKSTFFFLITAVLLGFKSYAQSAQPDFEGLWIVKSVKVGDAEMTPNARWTRFHADSTYESGNGKFQHSYGTWKVDEQTKKLSFNSSNGIKDIYEPFEVSIQTEKMIWKRTEEGREIIVELNRIDELPETHGDKLVGLWSLKEGETSAERADESQNGNYLFFRWDKRFILNTKDGLMTGMYLVDGHRPEVSLIPYDVTKPRSRWEIHFIKSRIVLKELNSLSNQRKELTRIHEFPE